MPPSDKLDALTRAAERWGSARCAWRRDEKAPTITQRMVATMRCWLCGARVAYGRVKMHVAEHVKELAKP